MATGVDTATAESTRRETVRRPAGRRWVVLLAPAAVYLLVRLVGVGVLHLMAAVNGGAFPGALAAWDGQWYLGLAEEGYGGVPDGLRDASGARTERTALAFFPGYPLLVRGVALLPGLSTMAAALAVSVAAGVASAYALVRLTRAVPGGSERAGLVAVALFAAAPMAVVLSMAFSEALFCALAAWALVGVVERRWLLAGLCCLAAGLVRPTAAALVATVGLAALVAVLKQGFDPANRSQGRRDGLGPWLAGVLAPLGFVGYLGWVGYQMGRWDGWFMLQREGWSFSFDGGASTLEYLTATLASGSSVFAVATVVLLLGAVVLLVLAWRRGLPWPLLVYGAGVVVLAAGSSGLPNVKARLLLPAFVLLLPVAVGLARRRPTTVLAVLAGISLASAWFGGYALTAWPYAI